MKKYKVTLCQTYQLPFEVYIQVNSTLSEEELENEISEITSEWNLGRLSEEELISTEKISGYITGTYSTWDGDSEPFSEVSVSLEEIDFNNPVLNVYNHKKIFCFYWLSVIKTVLFKKEPLVLILVVV